MNTIIETKESDEQKSESTSFSLYNGKKIVVSPEDIANSVAKMKSLNESQKCSVTDILSTD